MHILIIEPYFTGSHQSWAEGYQTHSDHDVEILALPGRYWKWRMHGGAVTLAENFLNGDFQPDLILATDMLDLTTFLSLTRKRTAGLATAIYFHENQLTYPWSENDRDVQAGRDNHYAFVNYISALAADAVFFNSSYHLDSFLGGLPNFLKGFPDFNELDSIDRIRDKSQVLSLGLDLLKFDGYEQERQNSKVPVILWNHRWEYDKNPKDFFEALYTLKKEGIAFELIVLGENFSQQPVEFDEARTILGDEIIQYGYAESFEDYAGWLYQADIIPVTSYQDFFGGSIVQAMYCGVVPLLPNRLAYPQHIPDEFKKYLIYSDLSELVPKLKNLIKSLDEVDRKALTNHVSKYDWSVKAKEYDQALGSVRLPK